MSIDNNTNNAAIEAVENMNIEGTTTPVESIEAAQPSLQTSAPDVETQDLLKLAQRDRDISNSPWTAAAIGAAQGISFSTALPILTKMGVISPEKAQELDEIEKKNKGAALAGEIAGTLATLPLKVSPIGATTLAGQALAKKVLGNVLAKEGSSFTKRVLSRAASEGITSAVLGAATGAGELVNEASLGNADFNAENLIQSTGHGALFGAGLGLALGAGIGAIEAKMSNKAAKLLSPSSERVQPGIEAQEKSAELVGFKGQKRVDFAEDHPGAFQRLPGYLVDNANLGASTSAKDVLSSFEKLRLSSGKEIEDTISALESKGSVVNQRKLLSERIQGMDDVLEKYKNTEQADAEVMRLRRKRADLVEKLNNIDEAEKLKPIADAFKTTPSEGQALLDQYIANRPFALTDKARKAEFNIKMREQKKLLESTAKELMVGEKAQLELEAKMSNTIKEKIADYKQKQLQVKKELKRVGKDLQIDEANKVAMNAELSTQKAQMSKVLNAEQLARWEKEQKVILLNKYSVKTAKQKELENLKNNIEDMIAEDLKVKKSEGLIDNYDKLRQERDIKVKKSLEAMKSKQDLDTMIQSDLQAYEKRLQDELTLKYGSKEELTPESVDSFIENNKAIKSIGEVNKQRQILGEYTNKAYDRTPGDRTLEQQWAISDYRILRNNIDDAAKITDEALGNKLAKATQTYSDMKPIVDSLKTKVATEPGLNFGTAVMALAIGGTIGNMIMPGAGGVLGGAGIMSMLSSRTSAAHAAQNFMESDLLRKIYVLRHVEKAAKSGESNIAKTAKNIFNNTKGFIAPGSTAILLNSDWTKDENGKSPKNKDAALSNLIDNVNKANSDLNVSRQLFLSNTAGMEDVAPQTRAALANTSQNALMFLQSKLPKVNYNDPYQPKAPVQISSTARAKFENYLHAIEKPMEVVKEIGNKSASVEAIEALRVVYPAIYAKLQSSIMNNLQNNPKIDKRTRSYLDQVMNTTSMPANSMAVIQKSFVASKAESEGRKNHDKIELTTPMTEVQRIQSRK